MHHRVIFVLFCLLFIGYAAQKYWNDLSFAPGKIIEVSHAHQQNLDGQGITVAILDEGFDASHMSLQDSLSPYRYNPDNRSRDISETVIYENGNYKFESHGTHVAGIITTLAPKVQIIPIKIGGMGGDQTFVKAIEAAAESSADIVNISMCLSYNHRGISPNVKAALIRLAQSGKLVVVAAGNEGIPMTRNAYTASLVQLSQDPHMSGRLLLVGASSYANGKETLAKFSNYPGKRAFGLYTNYFITAPGEQILSAVTGGKFAEKSGTSMAAPMVVGSASLLKQAMPSLAAEQVAGLLLASARKVSLDGVKLPRSYFGAGIVNLKSALKMLQMS